MRSILNIRNKLGYSDICICLLSFLASQRFFSPSLSALAFVPLSAFVLNSTLTKGQVEKKFLPLFLTLFLSIADEGGGEFTQSSHNLIRLVIFLIFIFFASRLKFSLGWKNLACILLITPSVFFLLNNNAEPRVTYLCVVFSILFALIHLSNKIKLNLNLREIVFYTKLYITPFILGELLNISAHFFGVFNYEYLSYSSFKFIIVVPFFLALLERSLKESLFYGLLTFIILINYQTRTIFILTYFFYLIWLIEIFILKKKYLNFFALCIFIYVSLHFALLNLFSHYKNFNLLENIGKTNFFRIDEVFNLFKKIDYIRFYENKMFFSQLPQSLMFGNGFGFKFPDILNLTKLTNINNTAYSLKELEHSYIVSFHDSWTFFGNNFGLFFVGYIYIYLLLIFLSKRNNIYSDFKRILVILIFSALFFSYTKAISYFFIFTITIMLLSIKDNVSKKNMSNK